MGLPLLMNGRRGGLCDLVDSLNFATSAGKLSLSLPLCFEFDLFAIIGVISRCEGSSGLGVVCLLLLFYSHRYFWVLT